MNRASFLISVTACGILLASGAYAQDEAPTLYPIDPKREPLLASIKRLKLFRKGEARDIVLFNPARKDTPVCRLDKEGLTEKVDHLPGTQIRLAHAILAAIDEEEKLDAKAKKELAVALKSYKIHTFNDAGEITSSRAPKDQTEVLQQVVRDVEGALHFRKIADHAKRELKKSPR
jgi:hypothetical protein